MRALALALLLVGCASHAAIDMPTSAAACSVCHAEHGREFASSPHARSPRSPVFEALLPHVEASWGATARARCVGCHAPAHGDDTSVTCVSCHAAVGDRGAHDARLVVDLGAPILGAFPTETPAHATRTSGLLGASELCATCHEVSGPNLFVEHTGTEHASAVAATAAPECAHCHLPATGTGPIAPGGPDRARHDHRFVGLDPAWDGTADAQTAALEASRALLASSLELRFTDGALELENVGAAHAVPTGVAFLRDVWVDLELTHADGRTKARARVIELGDRPMRADAPVALPTDADRIESRHLLPFEVRRVVLDTDVIHAHAVLRFRGVRADALEALGIDPARAPTLDVVAVER
jgi:hypothetical protein